jgi:hypothetical protein
MMSDDGSRRFASTQAASVRFSLARSRGLPVKGIMSENLTEYLWNAG